MSRDQQATAVLSALRRLGPSSGPDLARHLGVSQPTLSRWLRQASDRVLVAGRARSTRYAARRILAAVPAVVPVYEVRPSPEQPRQVANLHPVQPGGFYVEAKLRSVESRFYDDLPWFLYDLRPAGFLGRLAPRQHPELGLPEDILVWSAEHTLVWLCHHGLDGVGAFIVGDSAYAAWLERADRPRIVVEQANRAAVYARLAADVLAMGPIGSSPGGEQPKFLAIRRSGDERVPVIVKFSPPRVTAVATRHADLLVCEHLAHRVLADRGHAAARSSLLEGGDRLFLEVERFDREGLHHRYGQVSLLALDAELVGSAFRSWTETTAVLAARDHIDPSTHRETRWLQLFGTLVANTDMHHGNLSFRLDGTSVTGLAPAYDMVPMLYAPARGELVPRTFAPPMPGPADADVADEVWSAAVDFWERVVADARISEDFRSIARRDLASVRALGAKLTLLPRPAPPG